MRLNNSWRSLLLGILVPLALAACATTAEQQQREVDKQRAIEAILTEASEFTETERCLSPSQYRDIRILDDRHIVFEGRRGQLWRNTLPMRCPDLDRSSVLRIDRVTGAGSLCRLDSFQVFDWLDSPWYRRWPWDKGPSCSLGDFQPVNELQVQALKDAIKASRGGD